MEYYAPVLAFAAVFLGLLLRNATPANHPNRRALHLGAIALIGGGILVAIASLASLLFR